MEEVKRIYILLLHGNGLKIKDIAKELDLDKYCVADILFSTDNISFWYQDSSSLWFAKEGAIVIDEPEEEQSKAPIVVPKVIHTDRFLKGHTSAALLSHLSHLSQYRIYSDNELAELFRRYREGDIKARELIVKSQQKLVAGIAVLYTKYGIPLEDLIQEGNIGLIRAIDRFDYHRFRSFHNFAKSWILQAVSASMATLPYMVRLPLNQLALYRKVRKFKEKYEQQNGYLPSVNDIEIDDNTDYETIAFLDKLPDSLKELATLSENLDIYESQSNTTEEIIESEHNKRHAWYLLNRLNHRERHIIEAYFGINAKEESLFSIGEKLNLTRERVRQILWKTIRRLQDFSGVKREEPMIDDPICFEPSEQVGSGVDSKKNSNDDTIRTKSSSSDEQKRIEIHNLQDDDYKQRLSTPTPQKERVEEIDIASDKDGIQSKRKSREELCVYYKQLIMKLHQAIVHGKKHIAKPALLVAVIDEIDSKEIRQNKIILTTSLENKYNIILAKYLGKDLSDRLTSIAMPFWYLQSDKFWFLEPQNPGTKNFNPSKKWIIDNIEYARLDDDLWYLLQDEAWRNILRNYIIDNKLIDKSTSKNNNEKTGNNGKKPKNEKKKVHQFSVSTSLSSLVGLGLLTKKQLNHCHKKGLWTIGDVKKKIEYYHLTPNSTRFTKYTIDMWFSIIGLLKNNV